MTILAPSDDAFELQFSEDNLDELFITDKDKLRGLLREHLVAGSLSMADLVAAGEVTTLAGTKIPVTEAGGGTSARVARKADTVCADYQAAGVRIHIINRVLGNLPVTAGTGHRATDPRTRKAADPARGRRPSPSVAVSAPWPGRSPARHSRCRSAAGGRSWSPGR